MIENYKLSGEWLELTAQKMLPYFFLIILISTCFAAYIGYYDHNAFKMGDFLINYQGGFVRRGLLGEVIYQLGIITGFNVGFLTFLLQCFLYAVFLVFSYLIIKDKDNILPYLLLVVSPFVFLFQLNDMGGGFRKEIIYFSLFSFFLYLFLNKSAKSYNKIFVFLMILYPFLILTHEIFAVFLPYVFIVNFYLKSVNYKVSYREIFYSFLLSVPSLIAFVFSLYYKGSIEIASAIFKSLEGVGYSLSGGAIEWLEYPVTHAVRRTLNHIENHDYIFFYIQVVFLCLLAFIPVYKKLFDVFKVKINLLLLIVSLLGTFPLFYVALDWGRFIYIHMVSLFFLSLLSSNKIKSKISSYSLVMVAILIIYTQSWHIHHCCNANPYISKYTDINILSFLKPYIKTYDRLSE